MTLKINNDTITTTDLTGSSSKYFNTQLEQLIPNSSYSLLGSPLQRQLLKEKAESSLNYQIKYTPCITDIINTINNTDLFTYSQEEYTLYSGFSTSNYIQLVQPFMPGNNTWSITFRIKTPSSFSRTNQFYGSKSTYYYTVGGEINTSALFGAGYTSNGSSWDIGWLTGTTTLSTDTWYYYRTSFSGTQYKLEISTNGVAWTTEGIINSTTPIYQNATNSILCFGRQPNYYLQGVFDLSATKILIGNEVFFDGKYAINGLNCIIDNTLTQTTEQVDIYNLSPFSFSFNLHSDAFTQGTRYLLEHPNLLALKSEEDSVFFKFPWLGSNWYTLPNNILQEGLNNISLLAEPLITPYYAYNADNTLIYTTDTNFTTDYRFYNAILNGVLTKEGIGIYSGFSDTNTITVLDYINSTTNLSSFEIYTAININTASTDNLGIIDSSGDSGKVGIRLTTSPSNTLRFRVSTSGNTNYPVDITGITPIPIDKWFYIHVVYDSNTGYLLYSSLDKEKWTLEGSSSITTRPYISTTRSVLTIGDNAASGVYFTGSIDVYETTFTINTSQPINVIQPYISTDLYDNSLNLILPVPSAREDNGNVILNNETYVRAPHNDIVDRSVAKNIKLLVNNHSFTLVDKATSPLPIITTGKLGVLEKLVF